MDKRFSSRNLKPIVEKIKEYLRSVAKHEVDCKKNDILEKMQDYFNVVENMETQKTYNLQELGAEDLKNLTKFLENAKANVISTLGAIDLFIKMVKQGTESMQKNMNSSRENSPYKKETVRSSGSSASNSIGSNKNLNKPIKISKLEKNQEYLLIEKSNSKIFSFSNFAQLFKSFFSVDPKRLSSLEFNKIIMHNLTSGVFNEKISTFGLEKYITRTKENITATENIASAETPNPLNIHRNNSMQSLEY